MSQSIAAFCPPDATDALQHHDLVRDAEGFAAALTPAVTPVSVRPASDRWLGGALMTVDSPVRVMTTAAAGSYEKRRRQGRGSLLTDALRPLLAGSARPIT